MKTIKTFKQFLNESYKYMKDPEMDILYNVAHAFANAGKVKFSDFIKKAKAKGVNLTPVQLEKYLEDWAFLDNEDHYWIGWDSNNKTISFGDPADI
jgi:hypothetical protein